VKIPNFDRTGLTAVERVVFLYEFKAGINAYLAALAPDVPVQTLEEITAFNKCNPPANLPFFGQELLESAQAKGPPTEPEQCKERGAGGLSAHHCPGGPRNGTASGDHVHAARLERAHTDQAGIRVRAGDEGAPATAVPRHDAVVSKPRLRDPPAFGEPMLLERLGHSN
jgi:hypothetical protein